MRGDPFAFVEQFNRMGADASVELVFDQRIGHRVVVATHLDMIVDVDAYQLPLGIFVGLNGQGSQRWAIKRFKQALPRTGQFLEGPVVEIDQEGFDGGVQLGE